MNYSKVFQKVMSAATCAPTTSISPAWREGLVFARLASEMGWVTIIRSMIASACLTLAEAGGPDRLLPVGMPSQ